jgi:hypothetical protein
MEYNMSDSSQGSELMELDLQGSVENFSLPEILQLVATTRKTGTLAIQNQNAIVMVYFKDGNIIYAYGPQQTYHIGQLLKELDVLTPEQLEQAVKIQTESETSARLGEILIAQNFINRGELETVVKTQIEELLYSLLGWQTGQFKFYEDQLPTEEEITVRLSVENVILEGLRRFDELNMAQSALPDIDAVYTIAASQAGRQREVAMAASEWNVMALVDGHRTLKEICETSQIDYDETMARLARLKIAGIITVTEKKAKSPISLPLDQMVNRLANLFEEYLAHKSVTRKSENRMKTAYLETPVD